MGIICVYFLFNLLFSQFRCSGSTILISEVLTGLGPTSLKEKNDYSTYHYGRDFFCIQIQGLGGGMPDIP